MKASELNLKESLKFDLVNGKVTLGNSRMVLFGVEAFGELYQELLNIGDLPAARVVMRRFGEANGRERARTVKQEFQPADKMEWLAFGPTLHTWEGVGLPKLASLEYDGASKFNLAVEFRHSYLAEEFLRKVGPASEPVCWQLAGYIGGYCSEVFGLSLFCRETTCIAKGDPVCTFICKPQEEWL